MHKLFDLTLGLYMLSGVIATAASSTNTPAIHSVVTKIHLTAANSKNQVLTFYEPTKMTQNPGDPSLPYDSVTIPSDPKDIQVTYSLGPDIQKLSRVKLLPVGAEPCRCPTNQIQKVTDHSKNYRTPAQHYLIRYLGDWQGQKISQVVFFPEDYEAERGELTLYSNSQFEVKYPEPAQALFSPRADAKADLLMVIPEGWQTHFSSFIEFKKARGLRVDLLTFEAKNTTAPDLTKKIKALWDQDHFTYAILVGDKNILPPHIVTTSSSTSTPSDLPYFTYGGAADIIPDVLAGRIVANKVADAVRIMQKWIDYESALNAPQGWSNAIGVASDEGADPSDQQYVLSIEERFTTKFGTHWTHFYQDDSSSSPSEFNRAMNQGALWMTYVGHGTGTSWPSFGQTYEAYHIGEMTNDSVVKPVWIDVACQNGDLSATNAGATLMLAKDPSARAIGATAFYGGTVNISWHPPAILARGIAFKAADALSTKTPLSLGQAIQLGQIYLTQNHSDINAYADNQRWYVLQGDPSLALRLK